MLPIVSITPVGTVSEAGTTGTFTISRTTTSGALVVNFSVAGSATTGTDYTIAGADSLTGNTGWVTIADGANSVDLLITATNDSEFDSGETVQVTLAANPTAYNLSTPDNAALTIEDDEIDYALAASVASIAEGNTAAQNLTFTITRAGRIDLAGTVDYTIGGTAVYNTDFNNIAGTSLATGITGTVNFAAGETSKTITLDVLGDTIAEGNRDITVTLANPVVAGLTPTLSIPAVTTTIIDDETPGITVAPTTGLITTEAGGAASFTVVLNTQPTADVTVNLTSSNPAEGTLSSNSLTFNATNWNQAQTVTVTGVDDAAFDGDQSYNIITAAALSSDANYAGFDAADVAVTNQDNDTPAPDLAGNSTSLASQISVASSTKIYEDSVDSADTDDYYKFSLGASTNVTLSLEGLTADANVEIIDSKGQVIASSTASGATAELITENLEHGSYYVRVSSVAGAGTLYKLNVSAQSNVPGTTITASDAPVYLAGEQTSSTDTPGVYPSTDISAPLINMDDFRAAPAFADIDGRGYSAVILDTGIDLDDPYFGPDRDGNGVADRIVYHYDFADNDADATDLNGHGSNVSSIVASESPIHTGMAPGANIIHLKVFRNSGSGTFADIEEALRWVVENTERYNIASVNMSLSDSRNYNSPQNLYGISDELQEIVNKNVMVVSASGNSFYPFGSAQGVAYPSADPNSLSIGAVYDANIGPVSYGSGAIAYSTDADRITPFSQRHETMTTVFAPGAPIWGAGPGAGLIAMHGTSQAAPHVAGIAVLAQQLAERDLGRRLTQTEFANFLKSSGVTINDGDDEDDNVINTGLDFKRVDMLALGQAIVGNNAPVVNKSAFGQSGSTGFSQTGNTFVLDANTYTDSDPGDSVTYSVKLANTLNNSWFTWENGLDRRSYRKPVDGLEFPEIAMPSWLSFDPTTRTITIDEATRPARFSYGMMITGTDQKGASVSELIFFKSYSRGGFVIDGYIAGATVFLDANKNGIQDAGEPSTTTDNNGEYNLDLAFNGFDVNQNGEIDAEEGNIVAFGGIDTATNLPLETPVKAPASASVVTLLTSLVAELIEQKIATEEANDKVVSFLSLPAGVDLTSLDPIAATNNGETGGVETLSAMTKAQNFITQTTAIIDGASNLDKPVIVEGVVEAIAAQILAVKVINLSDAEQLAKVIEVAVNAAKQLDPNLNPIVDAQFIADAAKVMAASNQYVDGVVATIPASSLHSEIARVQKVTLDEVVKDLRDSAAANKDISEVISENTGSSLEAQIKGVPVEVNPQPSDSPNSGGSGGAVDPNPEPSDSPNSGGSGGAVIVGNFDFVSNAENQTEGTTANDNLIGTTGDDIISAKQGNDTISGNDGNDLLFGNSENDAINGEAGNDTLYGGKNNDNLQGGVGNDVLFGNLGEDVLDAGEGDDWVFGNQGEDYLDGGEGNDSLHGGKDSDHVSGNVGDDVVCGDMGNDFLYGNAGNDMLFGNTGMDFLDAGDGNDTLRGGKDNDILMGNNGDDFLWGDLGNDSLIGGAGSDRFVLQPNADSLIIADFTDGEDLLVLAEGLKFEQLTISADNNATLIRVGDDLLAVLNDVNPNVITSQDFSII
ncbi:S8 family serine peptidase [Ancylothrix sp. C2]|nr:S8 family serine peptidase [Ancylothrix sp. D3o]